MNVDEAEFGWVFDLRQAVVFVILDDKFANTLLEEGRVGEDARAALEFCGVGWQQVLHKPAERFMLDAA